MILHDARNPVATLHAAALRERLDESALDPELVVVIGGDGFLLHTVSEQGLGKIFLGLNAGRVGFLLNDVSSWDAVVAALQHNTWRAHRFPVLEANCVSPEGRETMVRAVNDVYLERASGQTARLAVTVDGAVVVDTLVADGIIVSTALGSTAYSFSAGGPACHPALRLLGVTPICPHLPRLSPFSLPETCTISIRVLSSARRPVRAVADGRDVQQVERVDVRVGPDELRLAWLPGHDFTSQMVQKILHP